ncbi:MAG: response regulator transcription factor [Pseudomonadota bacterium]
MAATIQVLLVEDNVSLAETVMTYLDIEGISCDFAATGTQGLELALAQVYQVILLDINLPRMDGLEVCEVLRRKGIDVPVLMLTARDTIEDKLAGFDAGTDDYLVKPFELRELTARVRALSNRRSALAQRYVVGPLVIDVSRREAFRDGQPLKLTPTGWKLLVLLAKESPNVVSRKAIETALWRDAEAPDSNALKVHLHRLRQQVDKPFSDQLIHTVASHGIAIRAPDD